MTGSAADVPSPTGRHRWAAGSVLNLVRGLYGSALLTAPVLAARAYTGREPRSSEVLLARILGARQLAQALACSGRAGREAFQVGAEVDLGHVATTVAAMVLSRRLRRAALIDTAVAAGFAGGGLLAARLWQQGPPQPRSVLGSLCRLRDRTARAVARVLVPGATRADHRTRADT